MPKSSSPILPARSQRECCYTSALDEAATFCAECGKPLLRCMATEECGGLLNDSGLCTVCVAPHLEVDAGALTAVKVGGAVSLPVSIANLSPVGRPLFITGLWSREGTGDWREEDIGWERLNTGESRPASIAVNQITKPGAHGVKILLAVASRWRWRQECYAFTTDLKLTVSEDRAEAAPIVNIGGQSAGHGNTVYISGKSETRETQTLTQEALQLRMVRAEKEERRLGLRGMDGDIWVPRNTEFSWAGFAPQHAPRQGPILTSDGVLGAGRSRTRAEDGLGDVRLLVTDSTGAVDTEASRLLSRRHFELYVECDRLTLRVTGQAGVRINGEAYGDGKTIILNDGDIISPVAAAPESLSLKVSFKSDYGRVGKVCLTRSSHNR